MSNSDADVSKLMISDGRRVVLRLSNSTDFPDYAADVAAALEARVALPKARAQMTGVAPFLTPVWD